MLCSGCWMNFSCSLIILRFLWVVCCIMPFFPQAETFSSNWSFLQFMNSIQFFICGVLPDTISWSLYLGQICHLYFELFVQLFLVFVSPISMFVILYHNPMNFWVMSSLRLPTFLPLVYSLCKVLLLGVCFPLHWCSLDVPFVTIFSHVPVYIFIYMCGRLYVCFVCWGLRSSRMRRDCSSYEDLFS